MISPRGGHGVAGRLVDKLIRHLKAEGVLWSRSVAAALSRVPRHLFLDAFYDGQRQVQLADPPAPDDLALVYEDRPLLIKRRPPSSCSQPAMVTLMLEDLGLQPGMRVLEIGTGSGWNAALMAHLVGDPRLVTTVEIQPELAAAARRRLQRVGLGDVHVITGDGGLPTGRGPFDRIVATASSADLAPAWLEELEQQGMLLVPFVLGIAGHPILAVHRHGQRWKGRFTRWSGFIALQGSHAADAGVPALTQDAPVLQLPRGRRRAPWHRREVLPFLTYVSVAENRLATVIHHHGDKQGRLRVGLWDPDQESLVTVDPEATDAAVELFGDGVMLHRLRGLYRDWVSHGRPDLSRYRVQIRPLYDRAAVAADMPGVSPQSPGTTPQNPGTAGKPGEMTPDWVIRRRFHAFEVCLISSR